ncbi:hypothetical protein [Streptomyces sp. NPDC090021]|uniref:CIS tube protein n=1 Tax=Streptomyces sp. NPDC090021 TaxID=3365919 RepID=UPI0037F130A8
MSVAVLVCTEPPMPGAVPFDFNPEKIQISRDAHFSSFGSSSRNGARPGGSTREVFKKAEPLKIVLSDIVFSGLETKPLCDQLFNWMSPSAGSVGQTVAAAVAQRTQGRWNWTNRLPVVSFVWGPPELGFLYSVVVKNASVTYTRFNRMGTPIRAKVSITLHEQPSLLGTLPTNPTSGGLPDRRGHTLTEGEDVVTVARTTYGASARWRELADANGIDDPLRVKPGRTLFLPGPDELGTRRPA